MRPTILEASRAIADARAEGAIAVVTMGSMTTWPMVCDDERYISSVPMMGGASALGVGLAVSQPERQVLVLDGDGSLLMQLGSLASIAAAKLENYCHIVMDNGIMYSPGGLIDRLGENVDFAALALAAGYRSAVTVETVDDLALIPDAMSGPGPVMIAIKAGELIADAITPWKDRGVSPFVPENQTTRMGDEGRRLKSLLAE